MPLADFDTKRRFLTYQNADPHIERHRRVVRHKERPSN